MQTKRTEANGLRKVDRTALMIHEMDRYFTEHPRSPAAVRRPQLYLHGPTFVALLGPNVEEGIVGLGLSVEAAFRAFDLQYLKATALQLPVAQQMEPDRSSKLHTHTHDNTTTATH